MKKDYFLPLLLAVAALQGYAQNTAGSFALRSGDELTKLAAEYMPGNDGSQDILWDLRNMAVHDDKHHVVYTRACGRSGLLTCTENNTRYYYEQRRDSLLLWGSENRLAKVEYDSPELLLRMPLLFGEKYGGLLHGTMDYCGKMFFRVLGSYQVEVDGTGSVILPSGDTIKHVSRVRLTERTTLQYHPELTTARELKSYVDSAAYSEDSIRVAISRSKLPVTRTCRWYAAGYRYPILETITCGDTDEHQQLLAAYYCPPEEQERLDDEENKHQREQLAQDDNSRLDRGSKLSVLNNLAVSADNNAITIGYDLREAATVKALVCNTQGMVFLQQTQTSEAGSGYRMTLTSNGLRSGEYILYLNANGQSQNQKIWIP